MSNTFQGAASSPRITTGPQFGVPGVNQLPVMVQSTPVSITSPPERTVHPISGTARMSQDSLQSNQNSESSNPPDDDPDGSDRSDHPDDDSAHSQISNDKSPQPTAHVHAVPYQYRYGMLVDSLPKLEVPRFDDEHNVKQYVVFRSLWDSIMSKPEFQLPEATKFAYLRSNLGGRPLAMADRNMILGEKAYATTMKQFDKAFGDKGRIVQGLLTQLEIRPSLNLNDWAGLRDFSDELVTLVETAKHLKLETELKNHKYAVELALKLPEKLHSEYLSKMWRKDKGQTYTVVNLTEWLEDKTGPAGLILLERSQKMKPWKKDRPQEEHKPPARKHSELAPTRTYTAHTTQPVSHPNPTKGASVSSANKSLITSKTSSTATGTAERITCLYCNVNESGHYFETCGKFTQLNPDQRLKRLKESGRCIKCAKKHEKDCPFPKKCKDCQEDHRTSLHEVVKLTPKNQGTVLCSGVGSKTKVDYDRDVLIKVVPLTLYGPSGKLDTFGVLDECAERTMILSQAVQSLEISSQAETVRIETVVGDADWKGKCVDFTVSARNDPDQKFQIKCAFTADECQLADYNLSAEKLQAKWPHLRELPLFTANKVRPAVLIGADHIELTMSTEVRTGPKTSSPVAVKTLFGWTVQGRQGLQHPSNKFLQIPSIPPQSTPRAVEALARAHKRKMDKDSKLAEFCTTYIQKLKNQGHVQELGTLAEVLVMETSSWFIPYHVVFSSNKYRLVFNCSFESMGQNLNDELLARPTLHSSLMEVLLRFRQGRVAVSGDITGMFHQVRLPPEDHPMFRFLWWDEKRDDWLVFQWLVLPFGAACSPCCATFALQKAAIDANARYPAVQKTIERETYVDNQLASRHSEEEARELVASTRECLHEAGFEMVKYASSHPEVVEDLPVAVRSDRYIRSLSLDNLGCELEPALGLSWDCKSDELCHPAKVPENRTLTKRTALRVLACQFEPLGSIAPFTARAKMIVQELWMEKLDWDEVVTNADIKQRWDDWCTELEHIPSIRLPRCYTPPQVDPCHVWNSWRHLKVHSLLSLLPRRLMSTSSM
ncbi:uncharacterized protein LOC119733821 [Patiria miniata]|uniref:Reverse transcriptase domain-containing protein n=1 Tax=Patiria miniata TaxID=46514 RepID=A0A914AI99_PATMI|nr:uncharacterized protein LOC119733821 [Patiria miniata]